MTDAHFDDASSPVTADASTSAPTNYGVGPFSIREVAIGGVWLVAFVVSFFSLLPIEFTSVWTGGLWWILTIGAPTVAVFLIALRRLSPEGIRRVGSLGIDQFASVAFSVSLLIWIQFLWQTVAIAVDRGIWTGSWVLWVEAVLMLAGVVLTVFAPIIPVLCEDFAERPEVPAHRNARPVRPVAARPSGERRAKKTADAGAGPGRDAYGADARAEDSFAPAAGDTAPVQGRRGGFGSGAGATAATGRDAYDTAATGRDAYDTAATGRAASHADAQAEFDAIAGADTAPSSGRDRAEAGWAPQHTRGTYEPAPTQESSSVTAAIPVSQQAFWALVPVERQVVDETGAPLFSIGPSAWALVVEDRGGAFVVRHEDGRTGFLHDTSGVTRG